MECKDCSTPQAAIEIMRPLLDNPAQEQMAVLSVSCEMKCISADLVYIGTLDKMPVSAKDVFRKAIVAGAKGIIVGHNHPSGSFEPSDTDLKTAGMLTEAGEYLHIKLLDFLIIGNKDEDGKEYFSLEEKTHYDRIEQEQQQEKKKTMKKNKKKQEPKRHKITVHPLLTGPFGPMLILEQDKEHRVSFPLKVLKPETVPRQLLAIDKYAKQAKRAFFTNQYNNPDRPPYEIDMDTAVWLAHSYLDPDMIKGEPEQETEECTS